MPAASWKLALCQRASLVVRILLAALLAGGIIPACDAQESPVDRPRSDTSVANDAGSPARGAEAAKAGPRTDEARAQRHDMVARQIEARGVRDPAVLQAMRNVPRHWFVPDHVRNTAYSDRPLPIGDGQTISQPYIVALMTEALHLTSQSKILEIGTGSGYQAAVLSEITPHVFSIEIVEPLALRAMAVLERRGYDTIRVRIGDGYAGWPEHAPFDAIIVTCAPDHIPPKLIQQLKTGGRLCIPVGDEHAVQHLVLATKTNAGPLRSETLLPVRFVPMTGESRKKLPD